MSMKLLLINVAVLSNMRHHYELQYRDNSEQAFMTKKEFSEILHVMMTGMKQNYEVVYRSCPFHNNL